MAGFKDVVAAHLQTYRLPKRDTSVARASIPSLLKALTFTQWMMFFSGWLAWTCDALDFFAVSLTVNQLKLSFNKDTHTITTSITLTLLFRSIGAVILGLASDRFGRKWPLVINMYVICILQIGSSFTQTFSQFLALRSLFGIAMGGVWGMASATALENLPVELRGLASGVLQQGYAVGYLFAAVINLTLVPDQRHTWRALFWVAAGLSAFAGTLRALLPESAVFLRRRRERLDAEAVARSKGIAIPADLSTRSKTRIFMHEVKEMLKLHWKLCIYAVLLMTGFNFLSHGSQDLYPTFLEDSKGFTSHQATVATIIGNCGAITGGTFAGIVSQRLGRRITIIIFILSIGAFIPLWIIPFGFSKLAAGAFCVQFGVQGAWGVIPIQLAELSPPAFRATFPGLMYQLGNMVSSASAQIEATGGEHLRTTLNGKDVPDYAKVQGILLGTVAIWTIVITFIGPEKHGAQFEKHALAYEPGGGRDDVIVEPLDEDDNVREHGHLQEREHASARRTSDSDSNDEKGAVAVEERENVREKI